MAGGVADLTLLQEKLFPSGRFYRRAFAALTAIFAKVDIEDVNAARETRHAQLDLRGADGAGHAAHRSRGLTD